MSSNQPNKVIALAVRPELFSGYKALQPPVVEFVDSGYSDECIMDWIKSQVLSWFSNAGAEPEESGLRIRSVVFTATISSRGCDYVEHVHGAVYSKEDCLLPHHWKTSHILKTPAKQTLFTRR